MKEEEADRKYPRPCDPRFETDALLTISLLEFRLVERVGDLRPIEGVCFIYFALLSDCSDTYLMEGEARLIGECLGDVEPLLNPLNPLNEELVSNDEALDFSINSGFFFSEIDSFIFEYLSALI